MKKILLIIVLSVVLLGISGGAVLAECCIGSGDCSGTTPVCNESACGGGVICQTTDNTLPSYKCGVCEAGAAAPAAGPPQELKDSCTLKNAITWKKGTINDIACPCSLEKDKVVGPPTLATAYYKTDQWGMICIVNSITTATNWIFYLLMVFVVVMIVIGGATYMMAAGNPEKAGKGKSIIIYGIIGLVIALVAKLIPSVVRMIVGM